MRFEKRNRFYYPRFDPLGFKFRITHRDKMIYKNYFDLKEKLNNNKKDLILIGDYHVERENIQKERAIFNNLKFANQLDSNYTLIRSVSVPINSENNYFEYKYFKGTRQYIDKYEKINFPVFIDVSEDVGAFNYLYIFPIDNQ